MKVAAFKYSKGISSLDGPILFEVYLDWRLMAREDFHEWIRVDKSFCLSKGIFFLFCFGFDDND